MTAGFIGLGVMGEPMAHNLLRSGAPLVVWNRSSEKSKAIEAAGASVACSARDVFARATIVMLMLADELAIDDVLERRSTAFASNVAGRTIVQMGTISAEFSAELEADIVDAGGSYVEAPVSGSRKPAEDANLIAMVAGERDAVSQALPLVRTMCSDAILCGAVPNASLMKFAVNVFLITMVTGLAEAVHFAQRHGLDMEAFRAVLDGGPMASAVSRGKLAKLLSGDFRVQAAIFDVLKNNRLIAGAARLAGIASPLLDVCHELFGETFDLGLETDDMIAVIRAIEARDASAKEAIR